MLTDLDIEKLKTVFATKDDLKNFATKDDIHHLRSELKGDINEVKDDIANLKNDVVDLKGDVLGLKGDVSDLKSDISNVKGSIAALSRQLDTSVEELIEYVTNSHASIRSELQTQIDDLRFTSGAS